jgi:hypothetical protein
MPISITITDNAGVGSVGASVAITGTSGAAVQVLTTPADLTWPSGTWKLSGSRTGDGSVSIQELPRHYFAIAKTASDCSLPERFAITDGLNAVATRCRDAIIAILKSLNLTEIGDRVYGQVYLDETEGRFPCIFVYVGDGAEGEETGLNELDYVVYPVTVAVVDVHTPTDHRPLPKYELWRQQIMRAFRVRPNLGIAELAYVRVSPGKIADVRAVEFQKYAGMIRIDCICRELRGVGA